MKLGEHRYALVMVINSPKILKPVERGLLRKFIKSNFEMDSDLKISKMTDMVFIKPVNPWIGFGQSKKKTKKTAKKKK